MFVFGEIAVLIVAFGSKNWHTLNWVLASFSIIVSFLIALVLPESPRYFIARKKFKDAYLVLHKIAKYNGTLDKLISEKDLIAKFSCEQDNISENSVKPDPSNLDSISSDNSISNKSLNNIGSENKNSKKNPIIAYFSKSKKNIIQTVFLAYVWVALQLIYYGIGFGN
jgi:hypothetical protein